MKDIHMLIGYCPYYGYNLAKAIVENGIAKTCDLAGWKGNYGCESNEIHIFYDDNQRYTDYSIYADINTIPALGKELLEKLLPYESMCIKLGRRQSNFPTVEYEAEKRNYHKHVRFWNWIIETRGINFIYFDEFPHNLSSDYVIYALAKVKNIPMLLSDYPSGLGIRLYASDIDKFGIDIYEYYSSINPKVIISKEMINGIIGEYYDKLQRRKKSDNLFLDDGYVRKIRKRTEKEYFGGYVGAKSFFYFLYNMFLYSFFSADSLIDKKREDYLINYKRRLFYSRNFSMCVQSYDRLAGLPDINEKFILFCMQMTPEATTIPLAGVFSEQYTSVQLIARIAQKRGIKVYFKEHFVQAYRDKEVFELIGSIPNVKLIKSTVNTNYLIKRAIAVATQTGTIVLEAAVNGVPALVTSSGCAWKGIPNMYEIVDEEQGLEVLDKILSGIKMEETDIEKYFYAISQIAYDNPFPNSWEEASKDMGAIDKRTSIIRNYISTL